MQSELCTIHASIDVARARVFLQEAREDCARLSHVYTDCFFDGSIAAAESAAQFALQTTDTTQKAIQLADLLKSLPTAVPVRTAQPLAQICAFLAFSFPEERCRAPLNTFCYADSVVRRTALRVVLERLHDIARTKPDELKHVLVQTEGFFEGIIADSQDIDRYVVIGRLVRLAYGMSSQVRRDVFYFLLELDTRVSSSVILKADDHGLEDYDIYLASELAALVTDDKSMAQVLLRSLVRSFEFGTIGALLTLWTCHRSQVMRAISIIGRDSFLFLLLALAARLVCSGNMSGCRHAVDIVQHLLHSRNEGSRPVHEAICSVLMTFCTSIGTTFSACADKDINESLADILRYLQLSNTATDASKVLERIRYASQQSCRWGCSETTTLLGILVRIIELWKSPRQLQIWIERHLAILISASAMSSQEVDREDIVETPSTLIVEDSVLHENSHNETFGALVALLGVSILGHPTSYVRFETVKGLCLMMNSKMSLFCLPSIFIHLQHETNGVVGVNIIRDLLTSRGLLQDKEASKITLNSCVQSLGQFTSKDRLNSTTYETLITTLGYATESAPGLATSLLLREVEKLRESFGLTRGPVRVSASAAILKLVKSRPSRGTNFIPFISLCIAPESMAVVPEAASLCFAAMNVMVEEEVLDPVKAVKVVMKNYPDVVSVESKARRGYLKLVGSVSRGSNSKKGALLANQVINLLRRCLTVRGPGLQAQGERPDGLISWEEVGQAAQSLGQFTVEEILRLAHAADEPLLDVKAEAERKEEIEKECQDFVQKVLSLTALAHGVQRNAVSSLKQLLVKIVSHEWENRQRSNFDPNRIEKLRAVSDALRRARQAREVGSGASACGIDGFARAVKGLPTGVVKGMFKECIWNAPGDEDAKKVSCFWTALRIILAAKALSPALPWVVLVSEVLMSSKSHSEERASCLAVLIASKGDNFELKDARSRWFGNQSLLFDSSVPTSVAEAKELFIGMVQFYPSEAVRLLLKYRTTISIETILDFIRASQALHGKAISAAAQGLFPVILSACGQEGAVCQLVECEFYDIVLSKCEEPLIKELLMNNITEPSAIRIACRARSYSLLKHAAQALLAEGNEEDLIATVGLTIRSFSATHRREFVLDVCSTTDGDDLKKRQHWLTAHVFGVAALLPYTDLALSVAVCFCTEAERDGLRRTIASIMQ